MSKSADVGRARKMSPGKGLGERGSELGGSGFGKDEEEWRPLSSADFANATDLRSAYVLEMSTRSGKRRGNTESESRVAEAISEALSL